MLDRLFFLFYFLFLFSTASRERLIGEGHGCLTSDHDAAGGGPGGAAERDKVHVHRVDDGFEVEGHLDVKNLDSPSTTSVHYVWRDVKREEITLAPTRSPMDRATRNLIPGLSCVTLEGWGQHGDERRPSRGRQTGRTFGQR